MFVTLVWCTLRSSPLPSSCGRTFRCIFLIFVFGVVHCTVLATSRCNTASEQHHTIAISSTHLYTGICNSTGGYLDQPEYGHYTLLCRLFFDTFLRGAGTGVFSSAGSAIFALVDDGEVNICKNVLQAIRNPTVEVK